MEILGEGKFSKKGMADAFQQSVGWALPEYITPEEGDYKVWNEKDYAGRNRSNCGVRFTVPPEKMKDFADAVEKTWREKYGGNPDFEISRAASDKPGLTFHAGTIFLSARDRYASYCLGSFEISLDPVAGKMWLGIYCGTQDNPSSRLDEFPEFDLEVLNSEELAKAEAEWDAKIRQLAQTSVSWRDALKVHEARRAGAPSKAKAGAEAKPDK
jgi:hypothetical protein